MEDAIRAILSYLAEEEEQRELTRFAPDRARARDALSVHSPKILTAIQRDLSADSEMVAIFDNWAVSVRSHLESLVFLISRLGGQPAWLVQCDERELAPTEYFVGEIARSEAVVYCFQSAMELVGKDPLREQLRALCDRFLKDLHLLRDAQFRVIRHLEAGARFQSFRTGHVELPHDSHN